MGIKELLAAILTYAVIGLSIYFIYLFFGNYEFIYLICALIIPLVMMFLTSPFFAGYVFGSIVIIASALIYYQSEGSIKILALAFGLYYIMFKAIRYGNGLKYKR